MAVTKQNKQSQMIQWALTYWDMGFSVIPISEKDKKPLIQWSKYCKQLPSENQILSWFNKYKNANIAIITGKISNILVVDLDNQDAINFFSQFFPEKKIPSYIPQVKTPRGGLHVYFLFPEELYNKNITLTGTGILHEKLDLRGEGGYVVAPPSFIEGYFNENYTWLTNISQENLPELPDKFKEDLISFSLKTTTETQRKGKILPLKTIIKLNKSYKIPQGKRDDSLFHIANYLIKSKMPIQEVEMVLTAIAIHACKPPFPLKEAKRKIESAIKRNMEIGVKDPLKNILIDENNCLTLKNIQTKTTSYDEIISNCILKPEGQIVDIRSKKIVAFKITKLTKKAKPYTTIIANHTANKYVTEFGLSEKQARTMSHIVSELFNRGYDLNENEIPEIKGYLQIGWLNENTYLHPAITDEKDYAWIPKMISNKDNFLKTKNDLESLKQILHICSGSLAIVPILFSLFTLHDKENGLCLEITGKTSCGKSIILNNASYLMGIKPSTWNATANAITEILGLYQNYPIFIDEIHEAKDETVTQVIYQLLQQEGRKRLNRDGSFRETKTFNANLITTGEYGIANIVERIKNVRPEGLIKRTISISAQTQQELLGKEGDKIKDLMRILREKAQGTLLQVWVKENKKNDFIFTRKGSAHYIRALNAMHDINVRLYEMGLITEDDRVNNAGIIEIVKTSQRVNEMNVYTEKDYKEIILQELHAKLPSMDDFLEQSERKVGEIIGWYKKDENGITYFVKRRPFYKMIASLQLDKTTIINQPWVNLVKKKIPAAKNMPYSIFEITHKIED